MKTFFWCIRIKQKEIYFVLTYFDTFQGPIPFITIPDQIPSSIEKIITQLMNLDIPETFFELEIKRDMPGKFLNRPFMIPSKWIRGQKERLLLTGFIPNEMNTLFIDFIFEEFVDELKTHPDIYRAFYVHRKEDPECKLQYNILQKLLVKTYKSLTSKLNQLNYIGEIPLFKDPLQYTEYNVDKINKTILKTFVTSIDSLIPEGATLLYDIGNTLGDRMLPLFMTTDLKDLMSQLSDFWVRNLLGEIKDLQFKSKKALNFSVYECFECSHMPNIGQPVCKFDEGILTKILSSKLNKPVNVKEVECYATGYDHCTFDVSIMDSEEIKKLQI